MPTFIAWPLVRFFEGLEAVQAYVPLRMVLLFLGLAVGWVVYVPIHELLHAAGCVLSGGEVHELQIRAIYGGELLARFFPFVTPGGEMAGRLSGFDTGGSELCYALTVLMPFLPGLLGFTFLALAARWGGALLYGAAMPWAAAPLVALPGDMYELGSLALYQFWPVDRKLVGDDLIGLIGERFSLSPEPTSIFIVAAAALGVCLALFLLYLSALISTSFVPVIETGGSRFS